MLPITPIYPPQSARGEAHGMAQAPCAFHACVLPLINQPTCETGVVGHMDWVRPDTQVPLVAETIPVLIRSAFAGEFAHVHAQRKTEWLFSTVVLILFSVLRLLSLTRLQDSVLCDQYRVIHPL